MSEQTGFIELTDIRRQRKIWQKEATQALATGKTEEALACYQHHDHIHAFETQAAARQGLIQLWNDARINDPAKTQIILAYTSKEVRELNDRARHLRREQNELGQDHLLATVRGERTFSQHDRIYFLKNGRQLGVMNGTLGTLQAICGKNQSATS